MCVDIPPRLMLALLQSCSLGRIFEEMCRQPGWGSCVVARKPEEVDGRDCQEGGVPEEVGVVLHLWWSHK